MGYLSDSLPDASITDLDRAILAKISQLSQRWWPREGSIRTAFRYTSATAAAIIGLSHISEDHEETNEVVRLEKAKAGRTKGLERLILSLSDQQLVTGFAVLIAGYINLCTRSLYYYRIIVALAWFSSTTHLSTLAVLRVYLTYHPKLRNWRVGAMLAVLGLLMVGRVPLSFVGDVSISSQCAFQPGGQSGDYNSTNNATSIVNDNKTLGYGPLASSPLGVLVILMIITYLAASYSDRIGRLYSRDPEWTVSDWLVGFAPARNPESRSENLERIIIASSPHPNVEQGTVLRRTRGRRRLAEKMRQQRMRRSRFLIKLFDILFINREIGDSFLGELLTLTFGVTYGIAQIVLFRQSVPAAGIMGDQNAMDFGQLVPLLFMVLPVFAAGEAYYGEFDFQGPHFMQHLLIRFLLLERDDDKRIGQSTEAKLRKSRRKLILSTDYDVYWTHEQLQSKEATSDSQHLQLTESLTPNAIRPSRGVDMQVFDGSGQTQTFVNPNLETEIPVVGRNDTETGLRSLQQGHPASFGATVAAETLNSPPNGTNTITAPSLIGTRDICIQTYNPWRILVASVIGRFLFLQIFAMSLAGAMGGTTGGTISSILALVVAIETVASTSQRLFRRAKRG